MTDVELAALAALVNAYAAETIAANQDRERRGLGMAYGGFAGPKEMLTLQSELELRGIIAR